MAKSKKPDTDKKYKAPLFSAKEYKVAIPLTFEDAMKKALTTPLPKKETPEKDHKKDKR